MMKKPFPFVSNAVDIRTTGLYKSIILFILLAGLLFLPYCSARAQESENVGKNIKPGELSEREIKTLNSLKKINGLYTMTYYANYDSLTDKINETLLGRKPNPRKTGCSLFTALGNPARPLYGRNFDNPACGVLLGRYKPGGGYASIAFSRMNDFGFSKNSDPTSLPLPERRRLLEAPFYAADGVNECGVSVALAYLPRVTTTVDKNKKTLFVTRWIREILDHAKNIDEAVAIATKYNIFDEKANILSHHILIGDSSGSSVIVEYSDGKMRVMPNTEPWQVVTNSPLYKIYPGLESCWRFRSAYEQLKERNGQITWQEGMNVLKSISVPGTQWSWVSDMKSGEIYFALYRDFDQIKTFKIKTENE